MLIKGGNEKHKGMFSKSGIQAVKGEGKAHLTTS